MFNNWRTTKAVMIFFGIYLSPVLSSPCQQFSDSAKYNSVKSVQMRTRKSSLFRHFSRSLVVRFNANVSNFPSHEFFNYLLCNVVKWSDTLQKSCSKCCKIFKVCLAILRHYEVKD